ncbi:Nn.00g022000.m01.CDS01 [Neocucurbitaria sp. VM-36]
MVAMYTIAGRQVGSHVLAIATLGTTFAGAFLAMGGKKAEDKSQPPINAKSSEEESFVKEYVKKATEKVQGKA